MSIIFRPRRGTVTTMTSTDKKNTVLAKGEMFIEVPGNGVGTGPSRLIIGNGTDSYESISNNHKYAIDGVTGYNTSDVYADSTATTASDILDDVVNGKTIRNLFGNLKKAVAKNASDIAKNTTDIAAIDTNQKAIISHVGMVIHSTTLDTEEKVKAIYGSNTTWIQHTGYMLRGASSGVIAGNQQKDGGSDTVTLTGAQSGLKGHGHGFTQPTVNGGATNTGGMSRNNPHSHTQSQATSASGSNYVVGVAASGSGSATNGTTFNTDIAHTHSQVAHTHSVSGGKVSDAGASDATSSHSVLPNYKNVYIWERTA